MVGEIKDRRLLVADTEVNINEETKIAVHIVDGTEVFLQVDFGDGRKENTIIEDARKENGVYYNLTHK